jgi:AAA+ superfamily predicted ATPase
MSNDAVGPLREAVRLSPDNRPLRQHLAATLTSLGRHDEAETEYREALARWPDDDGLKLGLADAYYQQGKYSHAMVIVESLVKRQDTPARAYLLHARLLMQAGEVEFAVRQYKTAVSEDGSLADLSFAQRLGIGADADRDEVVDGRLRSGWDDSDGPAEQTVERPKIKFQDVGGMEAVKEEIRMKIIYPLEHAEMFKAYGKAIGGGILMYGPPGCGKTYLARATAGEINAGFLSIGINDVLDMWIGNSERNLHELFEQARRNRPCVLFFDEVDALGASRSDMRQSAGRHLVNQFLSELDGVQANNDGVLILAATNAPWHVDAAFRRPGRFDRILFVPPPDAPARSEVLRVQLRGKPAQDIDYDFLGKKSEEFSGADMKAVVDAAVEAKLREAMKSGRPTPLSTKDLQAAIKAVRPSTKEWFATARNYALYSNQGGVYDDILTYLKMK